jgi:hypothetical protein
MTLKPAVDCSTRNFLKKLSSGAQRGFEPLTHALRNRRSLPQLISINDLRTPNAVYVREEQRKSACAGTKLATVDSAVLREPVMMARRQRSVQPSAHGAGT